MSYFKDVYLSRINKDGSNTQERIINAKERQFASYCARSPYRVVVQEGSDVLPEIIGTLQPIKLNEKIIIYQLLIPKTYTLELGSQWTLKNDTWMVIFEVPSWDKGYNSYKVYQMNRELTWWSKDKSIITKKVNFCGQMDADLEDVYRKISGGFAYREADNIMNVIMPFDAKLEVDCYAKINLSDRRLMVLGYDSETVPGVMFVSLGLTMKRDDNEQTKVPDSFWGVTDGS